MAMTEFTVDPTEPAAPAVWVLPALTVEVALYAALALGALFARLFLLDRAPLNADEARQALASWNFVSGRVDSFTGSPFLFTGNALVFALFGANDFVARFFPALFGSALVLLPALLRNQIGRAGALLASALFAFSPSLILFSRQADGAIIATTCALAALALTWRYLADQTPRDAYLAAGSLALALLAAREAWMFVLTAIVFLLIVRLRRAQMPNVSIDVRRVALVFAAVFIGVATTFLLHRDGIGAAFDLFGAWMDGVRPGGSLFDPLRLLALYEPIVLFFGAAALVDVAFSAREVEWHRTALVPLALWAVVAFVLDSIGADKNPTRVVAIVIPLTLVAAWYIGAWLTRLLQAMQDAPGVKEMLLTQETPVLALAVALTVFLYLVFAEFAQSGGVAVANVIAANLGIAAAGFNVVVMLALVFVAFLAVAFLGITTLGFARAKQLAFALALVLLSVWTFRQSVLLNYTLTPNTQEWLTPSAAAPNVRDLVRDLADASRWRANDSHSIVVVVDESLGAEAAWNLRDFRFARFVARPTASGDAQALLLPGDAPAPAGWIGQRYNLEFTRGDAPPSGLLRWLIFRDTGSVQTRDAVLWLPKPTE